MRGDEMQARCDNLHTQAQRTAVYFALARAGPSPFLTPAPIALFCNGNNMPSIGTPTQGDDILYADALTGTLIDGLGGNDYIYGLLGNDTLLGGAGDDTMYGYSGNDSLDGGTGNNTAIYINPHTDYTITYNSATNTFTLMDKTGQRDGTDMVTNVQNFLFVDGFFTAEQLKGGNAPDTTPPTVQYFIPGDGAVGIPVDTTIAILFSETVKLGSGTITLKDASGKVIETFSTANNSHLVIAGSTLVIQPSASLGYSSSYTVELTAGAVTDLSGNAFTGNPQYHFSTIGANGGAVQQGTDGPDTLTSGPGNDTLVGGADNDTLIGSAGDNVLDGGTGNDNLNAGAGDDTLIGGPGNDTMAGGDGGDIYYVDDAGDQVIETAGNAGQQIAGGHNGDLGRSVDKVIASINYTLTSFVENLSLATAAGNLSGSGNDLNNVLNGNDGNNLLKGLGGNDTLDGGAGLDTAQYSGKFNDYKLAAGASTSAASTLSDNRSGSASDGADSLVNVERLQFSDGYVALDLAPTQAAGKAVLVMAATLGAFFPTQKDWAGKFLQYFDTGASVLDGTTLLISSGIMSAIASGNDNAALVKLIYTNVYGAAPDAATLAALVAPLNAHTTTQAQWMADMALSATNQTTVNLAGFAHSGLLYTL
jgi:Ca2+-binding RTX toxin-like protein